MVFLPVKIHSNIFSEKIIIIKDVLKYPCNTASEPGVTGIKLWHLACKTILQELLTVLLSYCMHLKSCFIIFLPIELTDFLFPLSNSLISIKN